MWTNEYELTEDSKVRWAILFVLGSIIMSVMLLAVAVVGLMYVLI